ncbi:MAG: zinc-ribbon domain containing protein [Lewinella sp.]
MRKKKNTSSVICPCCQAQRRRAEVAQAIAGLPGVNGLMIQVTKPEQNPEDPLLRLGSFDRWACDDCLQTKLALAGNPTLQRKEHPMAHDPEYLAFRDVPKKACQDCDQPFVFTKEEQLFYYQTLGHSRSARAVRCLDCRRARREEHRPARELGEMLENGELKSEDFRDRVIENYRLLGREDKARYFEKRRPDGS